MTDWLSALREIPEGVAHAEGLIAGLDGAFSMGFGRLGADQLKALDAVGRAFAGTPLGRPVTEALASVRRSEFVEKHFVALAAARASLQGAQHDALSALAARALGREAIGAPPALAPEAQAPASHHEVWLESARQWLMELAIAGLSLQLGPEALLPFAATLENLQSDRALVRPAALLTGLFNELVAALPIASMADPPVFRWVDLWSRAMILAARPPPAPLGESVTGELSILGVDMRTHANFASAVAYGFLAEAGKNGAAPRLVRVTVSSFKVDVLTGSEVWGLFRVPARTLLTGMAKRAALKVQGMTLLSTGDLMWDDKRAEVDGAASAMNAAEKWLAVGTASTALPAQAALDRHPAQIAVPVLLDGYRGVARSASNGGAPELVLAGGAVLPIATERVVSTLDFGPDEIAFSQRMMGLLRFNAGRWAIQPLALAMGGKKPEVLFAGARGSAAAAGGEAGGRDSALGTLRERAGKLLRAKS